MAPEQVPKDNHGTDISSQSLYHSTGDLKLAFSHIPWRALGIRNLDALHPKKSVEIA